MGRTLWAIGVGLAALSLAATTMAAGAAAADMAAAPSHDDCEANSSTLSPIVVKPGGATSGSSRQTGVPARGTTLTLPRSRLVEPTFDVDARRFFHAIYRGPVAKRSRQAQVRRLLDRVANYRLRGGRRVVEEWNVLMYREALALSLVV